MTALKVLGFLLFVLACMMLVLGVFEHVYIPATVGFGAFVLDWKSRRRSEDSA